MGPKCQHIWHPIPSTFPPVAKEWVSHRRVSFHQYKQFRLVPTLPESSLRQESDEWRHSRLSDERYALPFCSRTNQDVQTLRFPHHSRTDGSTSSDNVQLSKSVPILDEGSALSQRPDSLSKVARSQACSVLLHAAPNSSEPLLCTFLHSGSSYWRCEWRHKGRSQELMPFHSSMASGKWETCIVVYLKIYVFILVFTHS